MKRNTLDLIFTIIALIFAALLRFTYLGNHPLDNLEATQALQVLKEIILQNGPVTSSPIYVGLTSLLFYVFGSSDIAARFLPALVGVLFVLVPVLYKNDLGRVTTILLMFFFAFDPFLIYLSREAGSGMLAIAVVICFFTALVKRKSTWLGITGALAALSGPLGFTGIAAIGGAAIWMRERNIFGLEGGEETGQREIKWRRVIFSAAITLLVFGFAFAIQPWIINGLGAGIVSSLQGWISLSGFQSQGMFIKIMVGLVILMPLTFILGMSGSIRGLLNKKKFLGFLSRWVLIAFLIVLIYPMHRVTDLAWVSIPLSVAAAIEVQKWVHPPDSHRLAAYIYAIACILLLIFCSLKITNLLVYEPGSADYQLALAGIALTLLMLAVSAILIGWGWSWKVSLFGLCVGLVVLLSIFSISMSRRSAGLGGKESANILLPGSHSQELALMKSTLDDLSLQNTGIPGDLDVSVLRIDEPGLRWSLRDYGAAEFVQYLPPGGASQIVITQANEELQLPASYRGQDFVNSAEVPWTLLTGKEWLRWILFGDAPTQKSFLILWARNDLFPEGSSTINE